MGLLRCIGQVAHGAVFRCVRRLKAEGEGIVVPRLQLHFGKVDAAAVDARRRPRLEAPQPQPQPRKRIRKRSGGVHPVGAGVFDTLAHDRPPVQIRPRADHGGPHAVDRARAQDNLRDVPVLGAQVDDLRLPQLQVRRLFERVLHDLLIEPPVGLRAQRPDRRALAAVEHPVLDARAVGRAAHLAAQRVELADKVALARAADGGVAGHVAHSVQVDGEHDGLQSQPCGGQRRFDAGVTGADDGNIKLSRRKSFHHSCILSFFQGNDRDLRSVEQSDGPFRGVS